LLFNLQEGPRKSGEIELHGTHQLLVYADHVNVVGENKNSIGKDSETLLEACKRLV
jgi:hypothetical protein